MQILAWILFGLIVGALAKLLHPGKDPGGLLVTIALGLAGSVLGGLVGRAVGLYGPDDSAGYVMSILGALVILGIYTALVRRQHRLGPAR